MKQCRKLLAALLCAALVLVPVAAFTAGAAGTASVSATVDNAEAITSDALTKLIDGDTAADATTVSDKMAVIRSSDAEKETTVVLTVDLGESKTLGGVSLSAFIDAENGVAAPSVKVALSKDGKEFYNITAESKPLTAAETTGAVAKINTDTTRIVTKAQYLKLTVTFTGTSVALTEIAALAGKEGIEAVELDEAYSYSEHLGSDPDIVVLDKTDGTNGTFDLTYTTPVEDRGNGALYLQNSQLIKAVYDETVDAYKVLYSKVNPWPSGHTGTETLTDGEILISIVTNGNLNAENASQSRYSCAKWIARGLVEGDYIQLDQNAKTLTFYPASHTFPPKPEESSVAVTSSTAAAETSSTASQVPKPGDKGIILFAVIAVLAVAGTAIAVKCRR